MTSDSDGHTYALGAEDTERARLIEQGELHRRAANHLVDKIDVGPGWHMLDVGCGPLGVLDILADRAGSAGSVTGLDREPRMLRMATRTLAERILPGVHLVEGDAAATGLAGASFDLVHERLVTFNIDNPVDVVTEMARLTRPGGYVALQDYDYHSWICHPQHPAWQRLIDVLDAVWIGEPRRGRQLPRLLRDAGIIDVDVDAHTAVSVPGDDLQLAMPYLVNIYHDRILASGAMSEAELTDRVNEIRTHLAHPDTLTQGPTLFQAWGRVPQATG